MAGNGPQHGRHLPLPTGHAAYPSAPSPEPAAEPEIDSSDGGAAAGAAGTSEDKRSPLMRAQQSLNFLKALVPALLGRDSPCHGLNFDLVLAIAAKNPPAERWVSATTVVRAAPACVLP